MVISVLGSRRVEVLRQQSILAYAFRRSGQRSALLDLDLALGRRHRYRFAGSGTISLADLGAAHRTPRYELPASSPGETYTDRIVGSEAPIGTFRVSTIHEGHVEQILNLLKISYSHCADLSKALPTDIMALRLSDIILLVPSSN
jgi:pilus assembly protein CpaE